MVNEKPPSEGFNEEEFAKEAEVAFNEQTRLRQALVRAEIKSPIDERAFENYLQIDAELLQKLDPYRESGFIDDVATSIVNEYRATLASEEDKVFFASLASANQEQLEQLYGKLAEHRESITKPTKDIFEKLERADLSDARAMAVWAKHVKGGDAVAIAKNGLSRYLVKEYIREGADIPAKLLLLLPQKHVLDLVEEVAHDEREAERFTNEINHTIKEKRAREESNLLDVGTHPKFAKKIAERKARKGIHDVIGALNQLVPKRMAARHKYIDTCNDPRELVDVILGVKDGKLGGTL